MRYLRLVGAVGLALATPLVASAQTVRGNVVERGTETVLSGVVTLLIDSAGAIVARALTNERGEYRLTATRPGRYRVHALRIGFGPGTSEPFVLAAGADITRPPLATGLRVSLDTIRVRDRMACDLRLDSAAATFAVWEQVRTALTATQLSATLRNLSATAVNFERSLDPGGRRVLQQHSNITTGISARPWRSVSQDSLTRFGYAVSTQNTTTYYAPDLETLASDAFMADHCLRLVAQPGRLGIAFEPTRQRRNVPEIAGTIWLDQASSELRRLEFRYVNMSRQEEANAGAELDFVRLANGLWLIARWSIRVPVIETRYTAGSQLASGGQVAGRSIRGIRVEGGNLALVTRNRDTLWSRPPLLLAGRIIDSVTSAGVANARVSLRGTAIAARTDAAGGFVLSGLLPGEYAVDVETPSLASIGVTRPASLVFTDSAMQFVVAVPTAEQIAPSLCPARPGRPTGMLAGTVALQDDSTPPRGATVVVEWKEFAMPTPNDVQERGRVQEVTTDSRGRYRICGLPLNTALAVRARHTSGAAAPQAARITGNAMFAAVPLVLDPTVARTASLSGTVASDVNGQPLADVEVAMPALSKSVYTNDAGAFRISDVPLGTHQVVVRRIGFRLVTLSVAFESDANVERRVLLSRALMLDTVAVTVSSHLAEFEQNRQTGLGHFLTRADLQKDQQRELGEVLSRVSGVQMMRGRGAAYLATRRGAQVSITGQGGYCETVEFESTTPAPHCACYAHVYLDNTPLYRGGSFERVPDLNSIPTAWIDAVEFYSGPATTPARYSSFTNQCGVVVIHLRRGVDKPNPPRQSKPPD